MSNSSIMSVRELIDTAFGEPEINVVNFKLIQTVLYLLARQLRLLERRVGVEFPGVPTAPSFSVTEIKLQATVPKKKKKIMKPVGEGTGINKSGGPKPKSPIDKTRKTQQQDKSSTDKSSDLTSSKSTTEKSMTDRTSTQTTDKTTTSSWDKTTTSTTDKTTTSSWDKTTTSITDKTTASSTDKTTTSTTDKTTTSDYSSTTKTSTQLSSSEKTKSSLDKSKSSSLSDRTGSEQSKKMDFHLLLDTIEQQREQELRVVNQRADSREVAEKTPTPMASLDSMEIQYEKLLVVERVTSKDAEKNIGRDSKSSKLAIVTQEEFDEVAQIVKELQKKFGLIGKPDFPENIQLMQDLRRGASLTDAMAALQLSARLEAAEKTLKHMTSLITDLAVSKGIDIIEEPETGGDVPETKVIYGARGGKSKRSKKADSVLKNTHIQMKAAESEETPIYLSSEAPEEPEKIEEPIVEKTEVLPKLNPECINLTELDEAMQALYDNLIKSVENLMDKAVTNADHSLKISRRVESKLDAISSFDSRMNNLELLVSEYAGKINTFDATLSSQMTNYQEQLTQMQHDLECSLETLAEALANPPGDTAGAAELNANFNNLHTEFDIANMRQKDLKENQVVLSMDVQALWKEIELLREVKSDRDEVADALRDKAGLGELNGLVTHEQFDAVRGDFEKRIGASYDKFNNQEIMWQKIIDDLLRELNEKADMVQVVSLRDDVNDHLQKLRSKIQAMLEIVGEPRSATISRRLFRDTACLSCASPAHMDLEEQTLPVLPAFPKLRPPTIGAEDLTKPKEDGDHGVCYPGQQIPHPRDPRSHFCHRYCGGSHTTVRGTLHRAPEAMTVCQLRSVGAGLGSDGKVYMMDEGQQHKQPCASCNIKKDLASPSSDIAKNTTRYDFESDMSRFYILPPPIARDSASVTPPPPLED